MNIYSDIISNRPRSFLCVFNYVASVIDITLCS